MLGNPSAELSSKMVTEEKERVGRQAEELGREGLAKKTQELTDAIAQNTVSWHPDIVMWSSVYVT